MSSILTHSPADVVRRVLIALNLGSLPSTVGDWPIQVSNEPDYPDNLITITDTAGITNGRIQRTGETLEHKGISIQVRGVSHPIAWAKSDEIRVAIDEAIKNTSVTIASTSYMVYSLTRQSGPIILGREPGTDRYLHTINAIVALRQVN